MGSRPPPTIDITKFYMVKVESYVAMNPWDCSTAQQPDRICCVTGAALKDWIDLDTECNSLGPILCNGLGISAQKIIWVVGPYNIMADCTDQL